MVRNRAGQSVPASVRAVVVLLFVQGVLALPMSFSLLAGFDGEPIRGQDVVIGMAAIGVAAAAPWLLGRRILERHNWARAVALVACAALALAGAYGIFGIEPVTSFSVLVLNVVIIALLLDSSTRAWSSTRRTTPKVDGRLQWSRPATAWELRHGWGTIALSILLLFVASDIRPRTDAEYTAWFSAPVEAYFAAVAEVDVAAILEFERRIPNDDPEVPFLEITPRRGIDLEPKLTDSAVGPRNSTGWVTYEIGAYDRDEFDDVGEVEFRVDYQGSETTPTGNPLAGERLDEAAATAPPFIRVISHGSGGHLALAQVSFSGLDRGEVSVRIEGTEIAAAGTYRMVPGIYEVELAYNDGRPSEVFEFTAVPGFIGESAIDFEYLGSDDTIEAVVRDEAVKVASNCFLGGMQQGDYINRVDLDYECPFGPETPIGYVVEIHSIELHGLEVSWGTSIAPDPERPWRIVDQIAWHANFETATATARMADGKDHTFTFNGAEFDWCSPTWAEC